MIQEASERGKPVSLHLGLQDSKAYRLYRRLGFAETGHSDTHVVTSYRRGLGIPWAVSGD